MPRSDRILAAVAFAAVVMVAAVPFTFRRPASTISNLGDLEPMAAVFARKGTGGVPPAYRSLAQDGARWGEWSLFPYEITTAFFPDSSFLAIVESPVRIDRGRMPDSIRSYDLGNGRYALVWPGPGADPAAFPLLARIEPGSR